MAVTNVDGKGVDGDGKACKGVDGGDATTGCEIPKFAIAV